MAGENTTTVPGTVMKCHNSTRTDPFNVGEGTVDAPTAVYDLKTGSATLTPARIQQIQSHLPGGSSVPVYEVRP